MKISQKKLMRIVNEEFKHVVKESGLPTKPSYGDPELAPISQKAAIESIKAGISEFYRRVKNPRGGVHPEIAKRWPKWGGSLTDATGIPIRREDPDYNERLARAAHKIEFGLSWFKEHNTSRPHDQIQVGIPTHIVDALGLDQKGDAIAGTYARQEPEGPSDPAPTTNK